MAAPLPRTSVSPPSDHHSPSRARALIVLFAGFVSLSWVAYTDYAGPVQHPLTALEREGLEIWRQNNCQACHQLHGFGGFHGPDLTNRLGEGTLDAELISIIASGRGRMPAFEFSDEEYEALMAWLRWMNGSGQAQPQPLGQDRAPLPSQHFQELVSHAIDRGAVELTEESRAGLGIWNMMQCGVCHLPFREGHLREPDLTAAATDRSFANLKQVLDEGRGRMPAAGLDDGQKRSIGAFLQWLADHRAVLAELNLELTGHERFEWSGLPWFEYR